MSLPQPLAAKIKSIPMDPLALANNIELAYMLSFSNYSVSSDSVQCSPKESYNSPLETYPFINFDEQTYETLYSETRKNYELKNSTTVKSIRNSFKEFFTRVSSMTYTAALKKNELFSSPSTSKLVMPTVDHEFKIDQMKGNNPSQWPRNLQSFHEQVSKLPWNAFSCEPEIYFDDFFKNAFNSLRNYVKKITNQNKSQLFKEISLISQIILMIALKTNNQTFILAQLESLNSVQLHRVLTQNEVSEITSKLQSITQQILQQIPVNEEQQYHIPKKLWSKGRAFMIMKKIHFQRQGGLMYYTITNDGTYLYIYVSSINGGMYKIGTGKNNSIAGKIYLEKEIHLPVGSKLDQVNWVYCKGKIYLKSGSRDPFCLQVINPQNFKTEGVIQLKINGLFGHQSLVNLNRNYILLTDGQRMYILGKQLRITQSKVQKKQEEAKVIEEQQLKGGRKKKIKKLKSDQNIKENQKTNPQLFDKVLQFVLYEFDLSNNKVQNQCDQLSAQQLKQSFNGYFTLQQCQRALSLNDNDLSDAAQWLVDQGEKERLTKVLYPDRHILIAQAQITSNFVEKNIKGSNEIITKQGSILHTQNVNESIWTMDEDQITCYSESGFKVFSKSQVDLHFLNENSTLRTTHLKTFEEKIQRNPQYTINYDPYNKMFYTFTWPSDGHYFPTAVLIGSQYKQVAELTYQKKISLSQTDPRNFNQFSRWFLRQTNLIDNSHCPEHGKIDNWLWYLGQKVIQLNTEINANNDLDKKKLINKRSKLLTKMNKINEHHQLFQKYKSEFEKNGKVSIQVKLVPPFGSDGSYENLIRTRQLFGQILNPEDVYQFVFNLQGWLSNASKLLNQKIRSELYKIREQLMRIKEKVNASTLKKVNQLLIDHFFEFFSDTQQQQQFIITLNKTQISKFVQKHHTPQYKFSKSIIYELKSKDQILQKYEGKNKMEEIFPSLSNISLKEIYEIKSIGNILSESEPQKRKQRAELHKFLEKEILNGVDGIVFLQYLFLQAFRFINKNKNQSFNKNLELLFIDTFKIIQNVSSQASISLLKNLSDSLNEMLQLYFASLCSLTPSIEITQSLLKILQQFQRKQIMSLFAFIQDNEFQGVSQTFQKIYQTPHPIQRGKNQNFTPFKNPEASLIYADFDKRCQSDPNHDNLTLQITHQGSPVGNSINCNDGVFTTNLRLTGKVQAGKPYLIMGNSLLIDFVSSGHAKDAKSFGRFGFKFGLRPIFAGKLKYKKDGLQKVQKSFGSKSQFEKYANTLKLLTICASNSIQNIVSAASVKEESQNVEIKKILNGKIFKQGYEEQGQLIGAVDEDLSQNAYTLINDTLGQKSNKRLDSRLSLLKSLHSQSLKYFEKKQPSRKNAEKSINEAQVWDFQGIPNYIKSYVEKIKNLSGDFFEIFLQARKLAMPQGTYASIMKKSSFTDDIKNLWLQGEAILFLTVLKHSGLLHLNIKFSIGYIKANLKAFEQARNGIFESFIRRTLSVKEWRDLMETYLNESVEEIKQQKKQEKQEEKKEEKIVGVQIKKKGAPAKTIKLDKRNSGKNEKKVQKKEEVEKQNILRANRRKQIEREIRQRLTQDSMIKPLCEIKNIEYAPGETYQNVSRIIAKLEQQSKAGKIESQSVYIEPIKHLIRSCLFLLKLKCSSAKHIESSQSNLEPQELYRSYSTDHPNVDLKKVNIFREWLQNWKKWKDFKKQAKVQLKFPISEIILFVNSWIPNNKFKEQMQNRLKIARRRVKFYQFNNILLKITSSSTLNKYALGTQVANIKSSFNYGLESVPASTLAQLADKFKEYSLNLKNEEDKKFRQLPLKLKQIQDLLKSAPESVIQKIKIISLHICLIQSQNPLINLDIPMYFIPLKHLNSNCQQLTFISSLIIQRGFLADHSLDEIIDKIWKEVGNDSISCKRWRDYFFIERVLFLLRKLQYTTRKRLDLTEKQKIAEVAFHLLYHLQVPLINRICMRILRLLKINLKRDIKTPFDKTYRAITVSQKSQTIQQFKIGNEGGYSNIDLIAKKSFEVFKGQFVNNFKERLLNCQRAIDETVKKPDTYNIIFNLNQEEEIAWLIVALFYLEQVQKTVPSIKDWDEYLTRKNKKKEHQNQKDKEAKEANLNQDSQVNVQKPSKKIPDQKIFINIPNSINNLNDEVQVHLPIGWYFNYSNIFNVTDPLAIKSPSVSILPVNLQQKKGKNPNPVNNQNANRKQWNSPQYMKLHKKFEDLTSKPLQQPKEDQPIENKNQFIKAKNFISRMRKHCSDTSVIFANLSQNGYYLFRQDLTKQKCEIICQIFSLASQNKLKPIPCQFTVKDYATRLSPAFVSSSKKSELKITCIRSDQFKKFNEIINAPSQVFVKVQNNPMLFYTALGVGELTLEDKCHLPFQELPQIESNEQDISIQFTKWFTQSSFSRMRKRQDQVFLKSYPNLRYSISQGGLESGLKQVCLIPTFDSNLTIQKVLLQNVSPVECKHEIIIDPEELIEKIIKILKSEGKQIKGKDDIVPFMLICCYLERLSEQNIEFINNNLLKDFQQLLSTFIRGFKSNNSIQGYRQKIHILTTKMLDSQNANLSQFRLYRYEEDNLLAQLTSFIDLNKLKSGSKNDLKEVKQTLQTHQYPKSNYLLPTQIPIPEQNKLLKYWEKNIIPRIHDFIKNSLKPLEIDDFLEQVRIQLRKGDQLQAKKKAYVICDNKLPAGAVLPDANHNWDSLTIDDISVGQDVIIKFPKSKFESSSPFMYSTNHERRVGQVMMIDQKNLSVLVRHRLSQYALFIYTWIPINSLEAAEQSLAHYSTQKILRELEGSLKGIIYNYSKIILTSVSKKIKIRMNSLYEETIVDMFRQNPVSGWNQNKKWELKESLRQQLAEGNIDMVKVVQEKFCPVLSYDIDLFSENIIGLNKFENSLGTIVSFKKNSSLIWYSGLKFYADQYGFKQIANIYASKSCVNDLQPLQFKTSQVYCKYYSTKEFLKLIEQSKYEQKEIIATIFSVDPIWTISTYLCTIIGDIAIEQTKYVQLLTRFNKIFLTWLQKRNCVYLCTELCRVIIKNTLRLRRIFEKLGKSVSFDELGVTQEQIVSIMDWINTLKQSQDKDVLVLYSPLLQNLIQMLSTLLVGSEKLSQLNIPIYVSEVVKMIQMVTQIQNSLKGNKNKKYNSNNDTQWERILVIENIPPYINQKQLRQSFKSIILKNNGKILAPSFDIFLSNGRAVILVDSWDVTELIEEEIIQKIQNEQERQPEPQRQQELLLGWACQFCTFENPAGSTNCGMCQAPAPLPKAQAAEQLYEQVQTKDVNQAQKKLIQKEMKRFENVKVDIKSYIISCWKNQCDKLEVLRVAQEKNKEERKKKKGKMVQIQEKVIEKPSQPLVTLQSGSIVLDKEVVQEFLKNRFLKFPKKITNRISQESCKSYLSKFKQLDKLGFDLWGDNISNESPSILQFEHLSQLMEYVQDEICKGSSSVISYNERSIRMMNKIPLLQEGGEEPLNFNTQNNIGVKTKFKRLAQQQSFNIRYSWRIIKQLNLSASKCLSFINMSPLTDQDSKSVDSLNTVGSNIKCLRQLVMGALKLELFQKVIQRTSTVIQGEDIPKIILERLKIKTETRRENKLLTPKDKQQFLFTRAHEQLQKVSSISLRPFKPKGTQPYLSFSVKFKGEQVQGEAGPYRQYFTDMSNELIPESGLNLFIKTPNNLHKIGQARSKWTINPKANSPYYLSLFYFLGRVMGCCIRTGCHMTIDLANFCWKLIADEKIKEIDVDEIDRKFYEQNKQLINCPSQSTFNSLQQQIGQSINWVYNSVDGEQVQLKTNGRFEKVTYDERVKYVEAMERKRIQQVSLQIKKIREGLNEMLPQSFLNSISGEQLKIMICGVPKVDVELLRKHTKYTGGLNQQSPVIKYFWEMMREIPENDRLKFIRFCWGQQRLPINSQQFERNGVRFMIKPMLNKQNQDQALPKADTCFFNIELPNYSSKQILKQRILLAINLDNVSINGDRVQSDDNPLMGNVDYEDEGQQNEQDQGGRQQ